MAYKICSDCKEIKNELDFYKDVRTSDGLYSKCKPCHIKSNSFNKNQELKDLREYLFAEQGGCCAICKTPEKNLTRKLYLDHNHVTGEIRGLLCPSCNSSSYLRKGCDNSYNLLRERNKYLYRYLNSKHDESISEDQKKFLENISDSANKFFEYIRGAEGRALTLEKYVANKNNITLMDKKSILLDSDRAGEFDAILWLIKWSKCINEDFRAGTFYDCYRPLEERQGYCCSKCKKHPIDIDHKILKPVYINKCITELVCRSCYLLNFLNGKQSNELPEDDNNIYTLKEWLEMEPSFEDPVIIAPTESVEPVKVFSSIDTAYYSLDEEEFNSYLLYNYNITYDQFIAMAGDQNNTCPDCHKEYSTWPEILLNSDNSIADIICYECKQKFLNK